MPDLTEITAAGDYLDTLLTQKDTLEAQLESLQEKIETVQSVMLPQLMNDSNMQYFGLKSGKKVDLIWVYSTKIADENWTEAINYLDQTNNSGIIKNRVEAQFPMKRNADALKAVEEMKRLGADVTHKQNIHPKTLLSFVTENIKAGKADSNFDRIFGVTRIQRVTIK